MEVDLEQETHNTEKLIQEKIETLLSPKTIKGGGLPSEVFLRGNADPSRPLIQKKKKEYRNKSRLTS